MTRLACAHALQSGIDLRPLLHHAGLTMRDIRDETVPISVAAQIHCLNLIAAAMDDDLLGFHVAQNMDLRSTGFLYYVAASADTLGDGLLKIGRYSSSVNEGVALKVDTGRNLRITLAYSGVSRQSDRHQIEAWVTALVRFCREMTGRSLRPIYVGLMHHRISHSDAFDSFLGGGAEFGAGRDELTFPKEAASLPIITADPYLNRLLTEHCERVFAGRKMPAGAMRAQVENAIAALLPHGQAQIEVVADKLGIGTRTLRRRLADEDTSFAKILQDMRVGLARQYLGEQNLSISRIAWLLGYTEVSAFSHAFRRWTGRAPRAARRLRPAATPRRHQARATLTYC